MKITFKPANKHPQESGQYLWRSCFNDIMLINVRKLDSSLGEEDWFGISEFGNKNVGQYDPSQFSEKIEFIFEEAFPKTNKDWFNTLPEPIRSQALANSSDEYEEKTLSGAISGSFVWAGTPEGSSYWGDIQTRAQNGEFKKRRIQYQIIKEKERIIKKMKAKFTDTNYGFNSMIVGKIYDVEQHEKENCFSVVDEEGHRIGVFKSRFKVVSSIEQKTAEITELKEKLDKAEKELAELTAPKVGTKYLHRVGGKYVLADLKGKFGLVCFEGREVGTVYSLQDSPKSAFCGNDHAFTPIEE